MTPELNQTLAQLAHKLGCSVEYLWPILVKHARLDALCGIFFCALISGAAIYGAKRFHRAYLNDKAWDRHEWLMGAWILLLIGTLALLGVFSNIPDAIYPQAAAIKAILGRG